MLAALAATAAPLGLAAANAGAQTVEQANCNEARIAPYSACVSSTWVSPAEDWLLAAEDEDARGALCVYLSRWTGRSWTWTGSTASCDSEPDVVTEGAAGHPTVYNASGHWVNAVMVVFY